MSNPVENDAPDDETLRRAGEDDDGREQGFGLSDNTIEDIEDALDSGYEEAVVDQLSDMTPADAAELLSKVSEEDRDHLVEKHGAALDPYTFSELDPALRKDILEGMPATQVASLLSEMDSDDALDLIVNLDPDFQAEVIRKLSARLRLTLQEGLSYPEDSAGRLMQREFVAIPQYWTVGKAIDYLRAAANDLPEIFFDIFVITPAHKVAGQIPLSRLVCARRSERIEDLSLNETQTIAATMDQEEAAQIFRRDNLTSAPVVDESERLIGVITLDDIVHVIGEETEEDFLRLAGLEESDLYRAVVSTTEKRFRWLFVNLLTAILASVVISWFDASIEKIVALAVLMPIVASMGGNAGTQTLAVAVRALARRELSRANTIRIIGKETLVGTLNGVAFALIIGAVAAFWFGSTPLGLVIAAAMIVNLICAGFFGAAIPIFLHRMGSDPAVSSAVFLTTVTDVVGFLAFLGLATVFLL